MNPGDIVELSSDDLRGMSLEDLVGVMQGLGLPTEGLEHKNEALTALLNGAVKLS